VDGRQAAESEGAWQDWTPEPDLYVSRKRIGGGAFAGNLDELRLSRAARTSFSLTEAPARDADTTLLAHFDDAQLQKPDFGLDGISLIPLLEPFDPPLFVPAGRFGGGIEVRESQTLQRFDTIAYTASGGIQPEAGTVELWLQPGDWCRRVANGTLLDAGGLAFTVNTNVAQLTLGEVTVQAPLQP